MKDPSSWVYEKDRDGKPYDTEKHERERAQQGFSEYDFWNFSDYHSWMMINVLEKFKTAHGYPADIKSMDEWIAILDEMIDGFKAAIEATSMDDFKNDDNYTEWAEAKEARLQRGMELFSKYYLSLWD